MCMRITRSFLLALLLTMLYGQSAYSEIYRWKDSSGKIHFTDKKPVEAASELIELKVNTYESVSYDKSTFTANSKVVMYSTVWCGVCKKAKRYFQKNNIPFKEYDVERSRKGKSDFRRLGGRGVPVILVGSKRMNGFSVAGFNRIYR